MSMFTLLLALIFSLIANILLALRCDSLQRRNDVSMSPRIRCSAMTPAIDPAKLARALREADEVGRT